MERAERFTVFEVRRELDTNEGRGGTVLVGHVFTEAEATLLAEGNGVYGGPGPIYKHHVVRFSDGAVYKLGERMDLDVERAKAVARALAKLTPEERRLLGR